MVPEVGYIYVRFSYLEICFRSWNITQSISTGFLISGISYKSIESENNWNHYLIENCSLNLQNKTKMFHNSSIFLFVINSMSDIKRRKKKKRTVSIQIILFLPRQKKMNKDYLKENREAMTLKKIFHRIMKRFLMAD